MKNNHKYAANDKTILSKTPLVPYLTTSTTALKLTQKQHPMAKFSE
jgi:hypothetical protein